MSAETLAHVRAGEAHIAAAHAQARAGNSAKSAYHQTMANGHAAAAGGDWDESQHPRDADGKFTDAGGGGAGTGGQSNVIDLHRSATREQWSQRPNRESLGKRLGKKAEQIRERDGHKCQYCGVQEPTVPPARGVDKHQLDHITPRVEGGTDTPDNLVLACKRCNSARHTMTVPQWGKYAKVKYGLKFSPSRVIAQAQKPLPELKKRTG